MKKLFKKIRKTFMLWFIKKSIYDLNMEMMFFEIPFPYYEKESERLYKLYNELKTK